MNGNASKQVQNLYDVTYVPRTGKYVIDITLTGSERVAVVTKEFLYANWESLAEAGFYPQFVSESLIQDACRLFGFLYGPLYKQSLLLLDYLEYPHHKSQT